jgi:hypothetical protein
MSIIRTGKRRIAFALAIAAVTVLASAAATSANSGKQDVARFQMFANPAQLNCLSATDNPNRQPTVDVTVDRGEDNDTATLRLRNFKPDLQFDLFTVQNSNQDADGSPVAGFGNFGMAWYQSDIHVNHSGRATVRIKTILLDQIFGFDPAANLAPTNTFHLGFWFNDPADAAPCGFTGATPFNGEHHAGPLAFITRPDAQTTLGPLCTSPTTSNGTVSCDP